MSVRKNACDGPRNISKRSVVSSFPEGSTTRVWLESLSDDQWDITAFMPENRLVCATVRGSGTLSYISLVLPELVFKNS